MRSNFVFAALFVAACSGNQKDAPPQADYHFQFATDAGTETYWCEYAQMPSASDGNPINVAGFRWNTTDFHHWALFRTTGLDASAVTGKPFQCFGSPETKAAALAAIVSQPTTNDTELLYPAPYAIPFASGEIVMLQSHTVNPTAKPVSPALDLTVLLADDGGAVKPLGEFQFYDPYIFVPANGVGHASMRCKVPYDIDIVYSTTHEHTRGTAMKVFLDPPGGVAVSPFLDAKGWEEPASKLGLTHVAAGSSFRVFCDYADHTGADTFQGPDKATNEMCQFYGFYSPPLPDPSTAVYFEACVPEGLAPGGTGDMYGTGAATCADTLACIAGCPATDVPTIGDGKFTVGACWQKCMVGSCPSASAPVGAVFGCLSAKCGAECAAGATDPNCQACLGTECSAEVGACQAAACVTP